MHQNEFFPSEGQQLKVYKSKADIVFILFLGPQEAKLQRNKILLFSLPKLSNIYDLLKLLN